MGDAERTSGSELILLGGMVVVGAVSDWCNAIKCSSTIQALTNGVLLGLGESPTDVVGQVANGVAEGYADLMQL